MWFKIEIIKKSISLDILKKHAEAEFWDFTKAVVDIQDCVMAIGGELHADEESTLIKAWSSQENLRWINLYPSDYGKNSFVEYDSMINIRPRQNNRSRGVEDQKIKDKINQILNLLIKSK